MNSAYIEVKKTNRLCKCLECKKNIDKGQMRIRFVSPLFRCYHAQCFVNLIESIPDIENLWKNATIKSVITRIQNYERP